MNVRPTSVLARVELIAGLIIVMMSWSAGCSFEPAASGLECNDEGAMRPGEVCRNGYWRIDDEADLDGYSSVDTGDDAAVDTAGDADEADGCTPPSDEEMCRSGAVCADDVVVPDPCTGADRTIDCSQYYDFQTDPKNCGGCAQACTTSGAHTTPACSAGECTVACEAGWVDANGDPSDGCESQCTESNGGVEICDGADNDCDGQVDGEDATDAHTFYADADGDGFGDAAESIRACSAPDGYVADSSDCNDTDAAAYPGAQEICDGQVDNNCDQSVDENCPCTNGESRECGTDAGICQKGTQTCANGQWPSECSGDVSPETETCDGLDNDCDGATDEDFGNKGASCTVGQGVCANSGTYVCTADGSDTECDATAGSPSSETCDGLDNDCDGTADEEFSNKGASCTVGMGECQNTGSYVCTADGTGTECSVTPASPSAEMCDGLDNDCDGQVDEDFSNKGVACTVGQGACTATGVYECAQDGSGTTCNATAGTPAGTDTCGDGIDNDCNGQVDDGCTCNYGGNPNGVCGNATLGPNGNCQQPTAYEWNEGACDGLDNDCDGAVDEQVTDYMYYDADGDGYGDSSQGARVCPGTAGYVYQDGDCDDGDPWTHPGATEICDDKDNNCNGIQRDNRGSAASNWCQTHFGASPNLVCDDDGPNNSICCEYDGDPSETPDCDFETICSGGVDDDGDGDIDCADSDCDGLSCGAGKTCQNSACTAI